ncbi:MAG: hypothetical protein ABSC17_11020, partial [Thermacetogeniaceae bacterium]
MSELEQNNMQAFNDLIQKILNLMDMEDLSAVQADACSMIQQAFDAKEVSLSLLDSPEEGATSEAIRQEGADLIFCLKKDNSIFGECLVKEPQQLFPGAQLDLLAIVLSNLFDFVIKYARINKQLYGLNTYLTISTNIQNNLNLNEQLQWVIYLCMDAVNASAASVLLLTQDEQQLEFFAVEGEKSEALSKFTMPADKGIAGFVLKEQKPVI